MTTHLFANNATGSLSADITSIATSLSLGVGEGALFPNPVSGESFRLTIYSGALSEIVEVTARAGDVFTIARAKENTTARAWSAGAAVQLRLTAEQLEDLQTGTPAIAAISGLTPAADRLAYYTGASAALLTPFTSFARTLLDDADASTARSTLGLGNTGVSAGAYAYATVTVDVLGRVTTITANGANEIATLLTGAGKTFTPTDVSVTFGKLATALVSTTAEFRNDTAQKVLTGEIVWDAAAPVSVAYSTPLTLDLATGFNFNIGTLTGALVLANPSNPKPGQSGFIRLTQDATGGRATTFGGYWKFADGVVPTLDTTASRDNILTYLVLSATEILVTAVRGVR